MRSDSVRPSSRGWLAIVAIALVSLIGVAACGAETGPTPDASASDVPVEAPPNQALPLGTDAQFFGPWSPVPFGVPPIVVSKMDAACRIGMAPFPVGVDLVVVDARGKGVAQLYYFGANGGMASCNDVELQKDGNAFARGGGSTGNGPVPRALGAFELALTDQSGSGRRPNVTASYLAGRAGAGIAAVVLTSQQGLIARATFRNGFFAVWIAGELPNPWFLRGLDASGAEVATLPGT